MEVDKTPKHLIRHALPIVVLIVSMFAFATIVVMNLRTNPEQTAMLKALTAHVLGSNSTSTAESKPAKQNDNQPADVGRAINSAGIHAQDELTSR